MTSSNRKDEWTEGCCILVLGVYFVFQLLQNESRAFRDSLQSLSSHLIVLQRVVLSYGEAVHFFTFS